MPSGSQGQAIWPVPLQTVLQRRSSDAAITLVARSPGGRMARRVAQENKLDHVEGLGHKAPWRISSGQGGS